jgi:Bacterial Ig-like domain (group 3)
VNSIAFKEAQVPNRPRSRDRSRNRSGFVFILWLIAFAAAICGVPSFAQAFTVTPPSPGCRLLSAPAGTVPAFCETFDEPEGTGTRSGDLNGTLWGVSRLVGGVNSGQGWWYTVQPTIMQKCGDSLLVQPETDVAICDGLLVDAVDDQTGVTSLAMYPKQPFDIAGRTGTIAFDVSDDSEGNHTTWPELWYSDQPVPVPFVHESSLQEVPRNGFGVRFAATCPANSGGGCGARVACPNMPESVPVVTVDSAVVVNNYISNDSFDPVGTISVKQVGCVAASSGPGNMNHFELRVSQHEIDVYGTDAGTTGPLRKIAIIDNMDLSLTRGLVWMEDVHYNGDKGGNQREHTFTWDNFAFDGPMLPRDLAYDVLDRLTPVGSNYPGLLNLGWPVSPTDAAPLTLHVTGVTNIANAVGGMLTFMFSDMNTHNLSTPEPFMSYRVNSGAWQTAPWPFGPCPVQNGGPACGNYTIAVPVPLTDVKAGANTIQFKAADYSAVSNVDLILQGAGGPACTTNCPVSTTTTLASSKNPSVFGDLVKFTATVAAAKGAPTGSVTFSDSGTPIGASPLDGSGKAALSIASLAVGTHKLTASYGGAAGFVAGQSAILSQVVTAAPPVVRFDWEDGGLDGWQQVWGQSLSLANSAAEAYTGKRSLAMSVTSTETHSAIAVTTRSELAGFNPGTAVTLHVYSTAGGLTVYPFAFDENWIPAFAGGTKLAAGWNTVVFAIPTSFKTVNGIGVQIDNPNSQSNTVYLDTVTTK